MISAAMRLPNVVFSVYANGFCVLGSRVNSVLFVVPQIKKRVATTNLSVLFCLIMFHCNVTFPPMLPVTTLFSGIISKLTCLSAKR